MVRQVVLINSSDEAPRPECITLVQPTLDVVALENNQVAFFLVDGRNHLQLALNSITTLRNEFNPAIYLRPIVIWINQVEQTIPGVDRIVQGDEVSNNYLNEWIDHFEPINQWIDSAIAHSNVQDRGYAFRILRFIVSRNTSFKPKLNAHKLSGYSYPLLDTIADREGHSLFQAFDFLENQKLMTGEFVSKTHFCCHCDCAFLNFKEVCPQCHSDDLSSYELIHHFKCAYVGELPEYEQDDELICPKCNRQLRHIGVDYDKPSLIHHCHQCNHRFQEAFVLTQCFNCGRQVEPENQLVRTIKAYQSTAMGNSVAIYGMDTLFTKLLEPQFNLFSTQEFKHFLTIEIERIQRYQISTSTLVFIHFDIEHIYLSLGAKAHNLFAELSEIFKTILRRSDVISSLNESLFVLLLIETSLDNAQIALSRFETNVNQLLTHNLDQPLTFTIHSERVNQETNLDRHIETFLTENVH